MSLPWELDSHRFLSIRPYHPSLVLGRASSSPQLPLSHSTSLVAKSSPQSPPRKPKEKQVKENILKVKMSGLSLSLAGFSPPAFIQVWPGCQLWLLVLVFLIVMRLSRFYFPTDQHSFFDDCSKPDDRLSDGVTGRTMPAISLSLVWWELPCSCIQPIISSTG